MNDMTPIKSKVEQLPIGIHFGVPDDIYFAQDALGSSDIKELAIEPVEWQFKRLHGEDIPSKAKTWGSALHRRVLEGLDAFNNSFGVYPEIGDALDTVSDLRSWLEFNEISHRKSANKSELIGKVTEADPEVKIWDSIKSTFEAQYPEDRRIDQKMLNDIEVASSWMQSNRKLSPLMDNGTFQFGAPELTVIYELHGVRCRARFDYVLPGVLIDLKTYRPWRNTGEPVKAITQALGNFRYDLQAASYMKAFAFARRFKAAGLVFGDEPYDGFLDLVFDRDEPPKWLWVMVKNEGAPRPHIVEFPPELTVFQVATDQVDYALSTYKNYRDQFGLGRDWQPDDDVIVLANEDFPAWFGSN